MATGIFSVRLEDLNQQEDELGLEKKNGMKVLKKKWQRIHNAKLEKEPFKME